MKRRENVLLLLLVHVSVRACICFLIIIIKTEIENINFNVKPTDAENMTQFLLIHPLLFYCNAIKSAGYSVHIFASVLYNIILLCKHAYEHV